MLTGYFYMCRVRVLRFLFRLTLIFTVHNLFYNRAMEEGDAGPAGPPGAAGDDAEASLPRSMDGRLGVT